LRKKRSIFDQFDEIDREVDRLFDRILSTEPMWDIRTQTLRPLHDIRETKESIVVMIDLPYVEKEAIDLKVDEESIDLTAELRHAINYDRWGTAQRKCEFKKLGTMIKLPTEVVPDSAVAKFSSGILTIELYKKITKKRIKVG
jgi:HSP20 family protein